MELIYCGAGGKRFSYIAHASGFLLGARLPTRVSGRLYFADQDWKKPDRDRYMTGLEKHKPHVATVLDLEREEQLDEVLSWAEDAAAHVSVVCIIPKTSGVIDRLPRSIGGAAVRLAYSVPTKYGGTQVPLWEFSDWPVHLLGGSPAAQMNLFPYLNVVSADGNSWQRIAVQNCSYWTPGKKPGRNGWHHIVPKAKDAPYEAMRLSSRNILQAWAGITPINTEPHVQEYLCQDLPKKI